MDFGAVRIHDDADAGVRARARGASAYTYGHHIVFESARAANRSDGLLAHELAHVLQQSGGDASPAAQVMRQPGGKDPALLSDAELESEVDAVQEWLEEHSIIELDYAAVEEYRAALEGELAARVSGPLGPAVASSILKAKAVAPKSTLATLSAPTVTRVAGAAMTPDEMVNYVINQRGFFSTAPRVNVDTSGATKATRGKVTPTFDPNMVGKALGTGFETHAVVQVYDAAGNLAATELGAYLGSGQAHAAPGMHAEAQTATALRSRLAGQNMAGGKMVVAVDQIPCSGCGSQLRALAQDLGLESYEVWGPGRESVTQPGTAVTPKTAARSATMGGTRPPAQAQLLEGSTFVRPSGGLFTPETGRGGGTPFVTPNVTATEVAAAGTRATETTASKTVWLKGKAKAVGGFGATVVVNYITTEVALAISDDPDAPLSPEDREALSWAFAVLPPGASIVIAGEAKFMAQLWKPIIEDFYFGGWRRFKEMNPDATPQEYREAQEAYDAFMRGDW
jgi:hypothetical protein